MGKQLTSNKLKENYEKKSLNTILKIFASFCILLLFVALLSQNKNDLAILDGGKIGGLHNWAGLIGAYLAFAFFLLFGIGAYFIALYFAVASYRSYGNSPIHGKGEFFFSLIAFIFGICMIFAMSPSTFLSWTVYLGIGNYSAPDSSLSGGVIGQFLAAPSSSFVLIGFLRKYIGGVGTCLFALALIVMGCVVLLKGKDFKFLLSIFSEFKKIKFRKEYSEEDDEKILKKQEILDRTRQKIEEKRKKQEAELAKEKELELQKEKQEEPERKKIEVKPVKNSEPEKKVTREILQPPNVPSKNNKADSASNSYVIPPIKLLHDLDEGRGESVDVIESAKETLQDTLNSFGINAKVTDAITGPRVTQLEVIPAPGVRVQKISSLESNIKLDLKAESIRILAPIPGKDAVGIEIPNSVASPVSFKGILASSSWKNNSSEIPIVLGKNVAGHPVILDLARAPHLLIAGATGSGKSVCVNTLIMSILYKFSPDELRLIMVDPKVVEFEMYKALPHLITPIVNDPKKVPVALRWAINEMERRYKVLAKSRVKNLEGFNNRPIAQEPVMDDEGNPIPNKLPFVVIIIDELADIMMVAKADVETSIARIAQKARAVGIHLVLATQRPSVQIITGVIKANLPTRIAFRVTSVTDSRVILDHKGAETLLGRGDMLMIPPGSAKIERIQGAMLSDSEIEDVVAFSAAQAEQIFDQNVLSGDAQEAENKKDEFSSEVSSSFENGEDVDDGTLLAQAIEIIRREKKASTSYLQRRLKIGYNRAAELIDTLEAQGVIGPQIGSSRREIFIGDESM